MHRSSLSRFTVVLLLCTTSACAYIIPVDPNEPRNNEVVGEKHRPKLNNKLQNSRPEAAAPSAMVPAAEAASAATSISSAPLAPPEPMVAKGTAPVAVAAMAVAPASAVVPVGGLGERRVPIENTNMQLAAGDYPSLHEVPPRPVLSGKESARARLSETQETLTDERAKAQDAATALDRDAAAEPSMLPSPQPAPVGLPSVTVPAAGAAPAATVPLVAPNVVVPPPATAGERSEMPAPVAPVAAAVAVPGVIAPAPNFDVHDLPPPLGAPVGATASASLPSLAPIVNASIPTTPMMPTVVPGSFDPLAAAARANNAGDAASLAAAVPAASTSARYASSGYFLPSRYATKRN